MPSAKIGDKTNKATLDGTEAFPITGSQNALVSAVKTYAQTIYDTLYSAFNHAHADSDTGGVVAHSVLIGAGTSLHVPTYSSDSTTFLNGAGEWTVPPGTGGITYSSDSTQYLNGVGEFALVADAHLSFTDITTNDTSTSKHGFAPKLPADSTEYLNGQGEWTIPPGTGGITYSSDSTEYLNGKGEFTVPTGGSGVVFYDRRWVRGNTANALDDEFNDGSIDAAWTHVDNSGHSGYVTWAEGADSLSILVSNSADAASELHALMKSYTPSIGDTIQCCFTGTGVASNYPFFGLLMADGTTYGSGAQAVLHSFWSPSAEVNPAYVGLTPSTWSGYNSRTSSTDYIPYYRLPYIHVRLEYSASNHFKFYYSPDTVQWILIEDRSVTLTPTQIGICAGSWGSTTPFLFSVDYFRVNAP